MPGIGGIRAHSLRLVIPESGRIHGMRGVDVLLRPILVFEMNRIVC